MPEALLDVQNLVVKYKTQMREIQALDRVSLAVEARQIVAIVGESGCGKSTLGLSIIGLLPMPPALVDSGQIIFQGRDLLTVKEAEMAMFRGTGISMVFQEPMSSLDPVFTVGDQLQEAIEVREKRNTRKSYGPFERAAPEDREHGVTGGAMRMFRFRLPSSRRKQVLSDEVVQALKKVQIADPETVLEKYPHELSGGIAQRVMIARALIERPSLLIADEPTSALDVTTQAQVLKLMRGLRDEVGTSIIFVTHDLAVAAQVAEVVAVMYAGEIVELAETREIFRNIKHPYSEGLIGSFPEKYKDQGRLETIPGDVPDLRRQIVGCKFNPRCKYAFDRCMTEHPDLIEAETGHKAACFLRYPK
jgi:oligopeptide/dipeptide ABC transporter ATP-binding protein